MINLNFTTIFPNFEDFHFWKDPGQIPFRFSKLGYDVKIVCYENETDYSDSNNFINIKTIKKSIFSTFEDIGLINYLVKNAKKINILNLFHLKWQSLWLAFWYKLFNPNGFIYLKMDNCHNSGIYPWEKIFDKTLQPVSFLATPKETLTWKIKKFLIKNSFINKIDLFSVEDEDSRSYFENKYSFFQDKIVVSFNGCTIDLIQSEIKLKSFEEKENLFITVGRLGTFQKNTLNLLRGFAFTLKEHNWKLVLAGPTDPIFVSDKEELMNRYPELTDRVKFTGNLNKPELFDLYNRAKILLLPSNFETFANVFSEAMFFGNSLITSPYTSLKNIVKVENVGNLVEPESPEEIGQAIIEMINNENTLREYCNNSRIFAINELNWDSIVIKIENAIKERN